MALTVAAQRRRVPWTVGGSRQVLQSYDVIVVGLGAMGSAALDHLSARGLRVLGIERYGVPHSHGSSGGDTRLIRRAYFEHPDYVPLLARAYAQWRDLEAFTGEPLLHATGILYLGQADGELIAGSVRSAREHGLAFRRLDESELARDFPAFRMPDGYVAYLEPDAGFLLCERAVRAQVARALERGAAMTSAERVLGWEADDGGVRVTTDHRRYDADGLVIAAGSWTEALVDDLDLGLRVTRQPMFWLQPPSRAQLEHGRFPCWAVQRPDRPGLFYGFPALPGSMATQLGVKVAHHAPGDDADPDAPRRPADRRELDELLRAVAPFVVGLTGPMTGWRVCLYTNSADGHFIVDRHPRHRNVVFGCGFSGHGFKLAPVMGEALADLVTTGRSTLPVEFLRLR